MLTSRVSLSDMTNQTETRYLQKLGRRIDGSLSHHWITLEILSTHNRMVTYTLVGSSGAHITEPLRDLLDREYKPVAIGELPEQFKTGVYTEEVEEKTENEQDNDFDQWLTTNYSLAGEDASNGEQWYLSNSPHEFMPISLSKLREQYNLDNDEETQEDELDNVTTFQIPEHYLSLIFNGDASGYSDEEIEAWEEFEQGMLANGFTNGHWSYPDNQESYFSHSNDVHNLGDNVVDLQWVDMS